MSGTQSSWGGCLVLRPVLGMAAYLGPGGHAERHAHHAVQLTIGVDAPVCVQLDGGTTVEQRSVVIERGTAHAFTAHGRVAMVFADPSSRVGQQLQSPVVGAPLPDAALADSAPVRYVDAVLTTVGVDAGPPDTESPVLARALRYVDDKVRATGHANLADAARAVALSPSRLTHRFSREAGIPFRRYVLWSRLLVALETVAAGADLTRAAAAAGFSDSAHLSRTFRANFGIPPSALLGMRIVTDDPASSTASFKR